MGELFIGTIEFRKVAKEIGLKRGQYYTKKEIFRIGKRNRRNLYEYGRTHVYVRAALTSDQLEAIKKADFKVIHFPSGPDDFPTSIFEY